MTAATANAQPAVVRRVARAAEGLVKATMLAMIVVTGGCTVSTGGDTAPGTQPDKSPAASSADWDGACAAAGVTGRALAIAGNEYVRTDVYDVQLCPLRLTPRTRDARASSLAWQNDTVVVSAAGHDVDRLWHLGGSGLEPIPGLGSPRAFTPSIAPDGRIAWVSPEKRGIYELIVWSPTDRSRRVLISQSQELGGAVWTSDGALLVQERTPKKARLLRIEKGGNRRYFTLALPSTGSMAVNTAHQLAVSPLLDDAGNGGVLIDAKTGRILERLPPDWLVKAWSPDGRTLMLNKGSAVGVWRPGEPEVRPVGTFPLALLLQVAWTDG